MPEVVIGVDTRESGPWIASELAAGLSAEGVGAHYAGLISTPGVAYLTRTGHFVAGIMVSASHNPFQDNGIKVFDHSGYKLPDSVEHELEQSILQRNEKASEAAAALVVDQRLDDNYLEFLLSAFPRRLDGVKVCLDCGNGAVSRLGPQLFSRLGATVDAIHVSPNGRNINLNCGALHTEELQRRVVEAGAAAGFAFDGDADRCIAVAASGKVVDGDALMLLCAKHLQARGRLASNGAPPLVVTTVMSNLGLEKALTASGIGMVRTQVGDKYVLEEMIRRNALLGGEQSGHMIFLDSATTGDGLLTALQVMDAMAESGRTLDGLAADMDVFPQQLLNIRVKERKPLDQMPALLQAVEEAEGSLGAAGRVVVRFSGTEPLLRIMVEAQTQNAVDRWVGHISAAANAELE
jgi:phosphoglucosamine mutase